MNRNPLLHPDPPSIKGGVTINQMCTPESALAKFTAADGAQLQTQFTLQLSQQDLSSIAVAEAESKIRGRIVELNDAKKTLSSNRSVLTKAVNEYLDNFARQSADADPRLKALQSSAEAMGLGMTLTYNAGLYHDRSSLIKATVEGEGKVGSDSTLSLSFVYSSPAPPEFKEHLSSIKKIDDQIADIEKRILNARQALNNVDSLERAARAAMAQSIAANSGDQGKALVQGIKDSVNVDSIVERLGV